jgi:hypothetical protein
MNRAGNLSLTPGFSRVWRDGADYNRFSGFASGMQTVETVFEYSRLMITRLKPGVNEMGGNSLSE